MNNTRSPLQLVLETPSETLYWWGEFLPMYLRSSAPRTWVITAWGGSSLWYLCPKHSWSLRVWDLGSTPSRMPQRYSQKSQFNLCTPISVSQRTILLLQCSLSPNWTLSTLSSRSSIFTIISPLHFAIYPSHAKPLSHCILCEPIHLRTLIQFLEKRLLLRHRTEDKLFSASSSRGSHIDTSSPLASTPNIRSDINQFRTTPFLSCFLSKYLLESIFQLLFVSDFSLYF